MLAGIDGVCQHDVSGYSTSCCFSNNRPCQLSFSFGAVLSSPPRDYVDRSLSRICLGGLIRSSHFFSTLQTSLRLLQVLIDAVVLCSALSPCSFNSFRSGYGFADFPCKCTERPLFPSIGSTTTFSSCMEADIYAGFQVKVTLQARDPSFPPNNIFHTVCVQCTAVLHPQRSSSPLPHLPIFNGVGPAVICGPSPRFVLRRILGSPPSVLLIRPSLFLRCDAMADSSLPHPLWGNLKRC